jgi:hypothetical protein
MNLGLGPLTTFAFFQWTQKCISSASAFISAAAFLMCFGSLGLVTFLILRLAFRPGGLQQLFSKQSTYGRRWGSLYNVLHESKVSFLIALVLAAFIRSAIVGFGHSGASQVATLIVLESAMGFGEPPLRRVHAMACVHGVFGSIGQVQTILQPWVQSSQLHASGRKGCRASTASPPPSDV